MSHFLIPGGHEELPRAPQRVDAVLPCRQPRPAVDARLGTDSQEVREKLQEGPSHRRLQGGILQGELGRNTLSCCIWDKWDISGHSKELNSVY